MATKIEWAHETWNPVVGCTKISVGCENCYAERMAARLANMGQSIYMNVVKHEKTDSGCLKWLPRWNGKTSIASIKTIEKPWNWKKHRFVFVCSMGDLFHESVSLETVLNIMYVINKCRQHTFLILTKRPERMREFFVEWLHDQTGDYIPNMWLGVTAENQDMVNERIPVLLNVPAAKHFVSVEPMLGPVDIVQYMHDSCCNEIREKEGICICSEPREPHLNWVICGGESGPGARPTHPIWVQSLRDQCVNNKTPFHFKQWGAWIPVDYVREGKHYVNLTPTGNEILLHDPLINMRRVGKKRAGRMLNGREWDQMPTI